MKEEERNYVFPELFYGNVNADKQRSRRMLNVWWIEIDEMIENGGAKTEVYIPMSIEPWVSIRLRM